MGRAERRLEARMNRIESSKNTITLTQHELTELKKRWVQEAIDYRDGTMLLCFAWAMHINYGFDKDKILEGLNYIDNVMGDVINDRCTVKEMHDKLEEDLGLKIYGLDI